MKIHNKNTYIVFLFLVMGICGMSHTSFASNSFSFSPNTATVAQASDWNFTFTEHVSLDNCADYHVNLYYPDDSFLGYDDCSRDGAVTNFSSEFDTPIDGEYKAIIVDTTDGNYDDDCGASDYSTCAAYTAVISNLGNLFKIAEATSMVRS